MDVFPTLLDLAGFPPADHPIDGRSLTGVLLGGDPLDNRNLFWHYPHYHAGSGMKPASAMRQGKFKLIEWHESLLKGEEAYELYDLETDPGESKDLSLENPAMLEELRKDLDRWKEEVGAQMPSLR
jgi:arylsulfatase A-like enzyme